ncbi:hypothetical protein J6590_078399 [Homalodisca vitripennis]|nr:hypothetical protein J6590_078399 [Homalodisca vitripennis]
MSSFGLVPTTGHSCPCKLLRTVNTLSNCGVRVTRICPVSVSFPPPGTPVPANS